MRALFRTMTIGLPTLWATGALAQTGGGDWPGHPHMMGWGGMGWGGWFAGPLMMLVVFALLVGAVVLVVRLLGGESGGRREDGSDRSLEILRERYARGEIDAEEFEARKKGLGG